MSDLNKEFTAVLQKSPNKGGWTYVIWPDSMRFFNTRGLVKIVGRVDDFRFAVLLWHWEMARISYL